MDSVALKDNEVYLEILKKRFEDNPQRHKNVSWDMVLEKLSKNAVAFFSLKKMEETLGEPDVVVFNLESKDLFFADCSKETPKGRRSLCYDHEGLLSRKKFPPASSVITMTKDMGITLLDEKMYRKLQDIESFDLKTSSWVATPTDIRKKGGAIFCDYRYGKVFTYHNGADSYYSSRGFRGYILL